jgi:hypothetical protein
VFGLDERIAASSGGASLWIVLAVAALLGLRHASDPDHLAAVTTLVAGGRERVASRAGELGLAWGLATRRRCSPSGFRSSSSTAFFRAGPSMRRRARSDSSSST